jgi:hypothetical protein
MAANLSIISSPPTISMIDEGIKYEIQRTTSSIAVKAIMVITLQSDTQEYPTNNLVIELPTGELTFVFKTTPDESGLQLTEPAVDQPLSTYAPALAAELNQNYYINKNYLVTVDASNRLVFTSRFYGSLYSLSFVSSTVAGIAEYSNTAGVDDATPDDYRIYVGVCEKSGTDPMSITPLGEDWLPVDDDATAFADMAEYLRTKLESSFHFPYNATNVFTVPNAIVPYFIRFGEFKDDAFQKLYTDFSATHYAVGGGLGKVDSDFMNDNLTDYFTNNAQRFLTWQPKTKTTFPDVPERLYFLIQQTTLKLMVKAYFADDTDTTTEVQSITADAFSVIELACGMPELFAVADRENITSYEVWIEDDSLNPVSETRVFVVDHNFYLNKRTLIFKNSFDCYDMLHCTGDLTISESLKREEMEVLTNNAFTRRIYLAENSSPYKLNSGWLPNIDHRRWLTELQLSLDVYLALGESLLPVVLTTSKADRETDREHQYSLSITFEPDYANSRHSSVIGAEGIVFLTDDEGNPYTDENDNLYFN